MDFASQLIFAQVLRIWTKYEFVQNAPVTENKLEFVTEFDLIYIAESNVI